MSNVRLWCPHCAKPVDTFLPVEPHYELPVAAILIGMTYGHLRTWPGNHPEVLKIYRKDATRRLHRMLPASAIQYIQGDRFFVRPAKGQRVVKKGVAECGSK
jgi:hypothetical protein